MDKFELVIRGLLLIYLVIASAEDYKKKSISLGIIVFFFGLEFGMIIMKNLVPLHPGRVLGLLPGTILMVVSKLSGECIGRGDALIIIGLGYILGIYELMVVLAITGLMCFVVAGILYCCRKRGSIPFVPFLCAGYYLNLWSIVMSL